MPHPRAAQPNVRPMNNSPVTSSVEQDPVRWDQLFQSAIVTGPSTATSFWSTDVNTGFRLSICIQGLLAIPAGAKAAFKLGVVSQSHGLLEGSLRAGSEQAPVALRDRGDRRWIRFPVGDLARVICKRDRFGFARHKIVVERANGQTTRFGFFVRSDFEPTSKVLQSVFGDVVVLT